MFPSLYFSLTLNLSLQVRCPIHVDDVVAVILALLAEHNDQVCLAGTRLINMGGPNSLNRLQMGDIMCSALGVSPEGAIEPVKRAELDLGFTSPLDISMDSSSLHEWLARTGTKIKGFREGVDATLRAE